SSGGARNDTGPNRPLAALRPRPGRSTAPPGCATPIAVRPNIALVAPAWSNRRQARTAVGTATLPAHWQQRGRHEEQPSKDRLALLSSSPHWQAVGTDDDEKPATPPRAGKRRRRVAQSTNSASG